MTTSKSIVWLHLSDLHLCEPKTGWDAHRVLESLIDDLKKMQADHDLQPDLMFFTGDAAFGSVAGSTLSEQYQDVEQFFTNVRQAFKQEIPKENFFLVPGNHDVDRKKAFKQLSTWLDQQNDVKIINGLIADGDDEWRLYMERLADYQKFLEAKGYNHLLTDKRRLVYAQVREIKGIKIGIGGFNSSWSCGRNGENGKLWLGSNWQNGSICKTLKQQNTDLKLALIHHPPSWFVEYEKNKALMHMERDFDFFLHGHEHQGWVNHINKDHVRIAGAACYEGSDEENGYNFVRLNLETGDVEIWLRKFVEDGAGGWISRVIPGKTNDHGLWPIEKLPCLTKLIRTPSGNTDTDNEKRKTNDTFTIKVRGKIKDILDTGNPEALAFSGALLSGQSSVALPENILIPIENFSPDTSISKWLRVVIACLSQARSQHREIKSCASEIFGWLLLLCVNGDHAIDVDNTKEIVVPVHTETGTEVFIARLEQRSAKFQHKGTDKVLGEGHVDPGDLELAFFKLDQLRQIQELVYFKAFGKTPNLNGNWLGLLKNFLDINANNTKKMIYLTLPKTRYSEHLDMIKTLKTDLPHLQVLIVGVDNNGGNSVLIMDESRLEAYVLTFLKTLAEY